MRVKILKQIPGWPGVGRVIEIPPTVAAPHIEAGHIEDIDTVYDKVPILKAGHIKRLYPVEFGDVIPTPSRSRMVADEPEIDPVEYPKDSGLRFVPVEELPDDSKSQVKKRAKKVKK